MSRTPHLPRDLPVADPGVTVGPVEGEHVEPVRGLWGALGFTRPAPVDSEEGEGWEEYVHPGRRDRGLHYTHEGDSEGDGAALERDRRKAERRRDRAQRRSDPRRGLGTGSISYHRKGAKRVARRSGQVPVPLGRPRPAAPGARLAGDVAVALLRWLGSSGGGSARHRRRRR